MYSTNYHFYNPKNYLYSKSVKGLQSFELDYRFSFNGKEKDIEGMGGGGSTYDYGFRIYNAQLGRFLSVDPLTKSYPWNSTYAFAENDVISCIDLDGLEKYDVKIVNNQDGTKTAFVKLTCFDLSSSDVTITEDGQTNITTNDFRYRKIQDFMDRLKYNANEKSIFYNGDEKPVAGPVPKNAVYDNKTDPNCTQSTPDFNFPVLLTACDLNSPTKITLTSNVGMTMIASNDLTQIANLAANGNSVTNVSGTNIVNKIQITAIDQAAANSLMAVLLTDPNVTANMFKVPIIDPNVTGGFATYQPQNEQQVNNPNPTPCP
jgi:RHS repeat-associated protein